MGWRAGGYPFREVLAEVRANLEVLEKCPGPHDFQKIGDGKVFDAKWRCAECAASSIIRQPPGTPAAWLTLTGSRSATERPTIIGMSTRVSAARFLRRRLGCVA